VACPRDPQSASRRPERPSASPRARLGVAAAALALLALPAAAQDTGVAPERRDDFGPLADRPDLAEFEGRLIRRVQLVGITPATRRRPERVGPLDPAEEQLVRNTLRAVEGTPYRQQTITADIATLNRLGRFARVNSRVQLLDDGSVVLLYDLVSQPLVEDVQVVGNNQITDQDLRDETDWQLLVQTGQEEWEGTRAAMTTDGTGFSRVRVLPYVDDMASAYRVADLVVCRAGAMTLAELEVLGKPAVLVPFPHATDDHQTRNAQALAERGAARVVADADLDGDVLADLLAGFRAEPATLSALRDAARSHALGRDAAHELASAILARAEGRAA